MKEGTINILVSEYQRLTTLEEIRMNYYEKALQLYLTIITATVGAIILLFEKKTDFNMPNDWYLLMLSLLIVFGEITFLRMLGMDVGRLEIGKALQLIRKRFVDNEPDLENAFSQNVSSSKEIYKKWSSINGIIRRSFTLSQHKTFIVIINSMLFTTLIFFLIQPYTINFFVNIFLLIIIFVIYSFFHVLYAHIRYSQIVDNKYFDTSLWA